MASQGLPDPWESIEAFEDVVGRYREVGVDEFILDQPRPDQVPVLERVADEIVPRIRLEAARQGRVMR